MIIIGDIIIGDSDWLYLLVRVLIIGDIIIGDSDLVTPDCVQLVPVFLVTVTVFGDKY